MVGKPTGVHSAFKVRSIDAFTMVYSKDEGGVDGSMTIDRDHCQWYRIRNGYSSVQQSRRTVTLMRDLSTCLLEMIDT